MYYWTRKYSKFLVIFWFNVLLNFDCFLPSFLPVQGVTSKKYANYLLSTFFFYIQIYLFYLFSFREFLLLHAQNENIHQRKHWTVAYCSHLKRISILFVRSLIVSTFVLSWGLKKMKPVAFDNFYYSSA